MNTGKSAKREGVQAAEQFMVKISGWNESKQFEAQCRNPFCGGEVGGCQHSASDASVVPTGGNVGVPEMREATDSLMAVQGQELQRCMYCGVMSY